MLRRVLAAVAALVLAIVGALLVVGYAQRADQRATAAQETVEVLVASEALAGGTKAAELEDLVEVKLVPQGVVVQGAIDSLSDVKGHVLTDDLAPGEQLHTARFASQEELRAQGETPLPEGVKDLHQVTIPLDKARALGGSIAAGDTVGVFMSFDAKETGGEEGSGQQVSMTHLTLHKVPVVRVEGAYVAPPSRAQDDEEDAAEQTAEDTIFVTLAMPAPDAERLVFGMEWGEIWLSYEPENADENGTQEVVVTLPDEARDIFQ